jgi:uncharacterized membrane protein
MDPFTQLVAATAAFLLTHLASSTPLRPALNGAIGEKGYRALYSVTAFATLIWMVYAYNRAPTEALWPGLKLLPAILMPFAFILLACGLLSRNPTMVGAEKLLKSEDPARGIIRVTRHPVMWAIGLWAAAHLLARGDLKSVVFFGGLLVLALVGAAALDARKAKTLGEDWKRFAAVTSHLPLDAVASGRNRIKWKEIGWRNPVIGIALYAGFFAAHAWLFSAPPWPT